VVCGRLGDRQLSYFFQCAIGVIDAVGLVAGPAELLPDPADEVLLPGGVAGGEAAPGGRGEQAGEGDGFGVGGGEDPGSGEVAGFTAGPRDRLQRGEAQRFGMGPAIVLGQDLAEGAWPVGDGAVADLAPSDRKTAHRDREAAGA
jgi:hypothetical protein